jgi:predicted O-methyltransferase YrrM
VLRETAKQLVARVARTPVGKHLVHAAVLQDPSELRFSRVERWPDEIRGFEDLAFLFSSNQLNHGIASLRLDEAALLYKVARDAGPATLAEIGRFKGGSTLITAAAMHEDADLWSYDLHVDLSPDLPGEQLDRELQAALERLGLKKHVHLVVGDSHAALPPDEPLASLFIDGDHSYEGAREDYLHWRDHVGAGGHMLFHDAVDPGGYGNHYPGTERVVQEVTRDDRDFVRQPDAGSIAHFVRRP